MARRRGWPSAPYRVRGGGQTEPVERGGLERVAAVAAGAVGLVGYLYALGGIVVWLHLKTAQLPLDGAIVATDDRHLLAIGLRVVAFEAFLLIAICAIVALLTGISAALRRGPPPGPDTNIDGLDKAWKSRRTLFGFAGPEVGLLLVSLGLGAQGPTSTRTFLVIAGSFTGAAAGVLMILRLPRDPAVGKPESRTLKFGLRLLALVLLAAAIVIGLRVLPILQGTFLLAGTALIYTGPFLKWPGEEDEHTIGYELLRSGGVWATIAFSTAVALAWVATPPVTFTRAMVESVDRTASHPGAYLDRGENGVYLGTCTVDEERSGKYEVSKESRITLVPSRESARVRLGQAKYRFDPGGRPSLWQAITAGVGGAATENAVLHHPLRGQAAQVCDPNP
jgi:hypothetical protein